MTRSVPSHLRSGPTTVLVLSLLFIAFVVLLHVSWRCSIDPRHDCCTRLRPLTVLWNMHADLGQIPQGLSSRPRDGDHVRR